MIGLNLWWLIKDKKLNSTRIIKKNTKTQGEYTENGVKPMFYRQHSISILFAIFFSDLVVNRQACSVCLIRKFLEVLLDNSYEFANFKLSEQACLFTTKNINFVDSHGNYKLRF